MSLRKRIEAKIAEVADGNQLSIAQIVTIDEVEKAIVDMEEQLESANQRIDYLEDHPALSFPVPNSDEVVPPEEPTGAVDAKEDSLPSGSEAAPVDQPAGM